MIRVALVTANFPSTGQLYIFEWVRALKRTGVDVTILTEIYSDNDFPGGNTERDEWVQHVIPLYSISRPFKNIQFKPLALLSWLVHPVKFLRMVSHLKRDFKFSTCLRKVFEYLPAFDKKFDLVHFNAPQIAVRRFELGKLFGARTLVSFRGQDFTFTPERYDCLLKDADHLHFISNFLVGQAKERGYDGSHHTLIPPMVDTDLYKPAPHAQTVDRDPQHSWTLFSAARLEWVKGWEFALQAVALLVERGWDVQYYIAGDGKLRDLLVYTIDQLGIADRVHLLGWQSPEQVRDWMQKADLYLLASVEEAFNNSVLQAQACGLPVVCSDEGGLPENIADGVTGLLARRRDAWDMADKIESILRNPIVLNDMKSAGPERVRSHFSLQNGVGLFAGIYQSACSDGGG